MSNDKARADGVATAGAALRPTGCRNLWLGLAIVVAALALDQLTKWIILTHVMNPPRLIPVSPFFNLTLGLNRGVSFGMLSERFGGTPWMLIALSGIIVAILFVWLARAGGTIEALGLGAIIGGAAGNIVDRVRFGGVVDFLDFHVRDWHWPAFNTADAAIASGVALLLLDAFLNRRGA